jgi:uncharacterized membrane protein (Fun14 family)
LTSFADRLFPVAGLLVIVSPAAYDSSMSQPETRIPVAQPVETKPSLGRRSAGTARKHYATLSGWKKLLLVLSILIAVLGTLGTVIGYVRGRSPERAEAQQTVEQIRSSVPPGASLTPQQQERLDQATQQMRAAGHWFYEKTAPHLARIGFGFFIAFILGYMFRQFIKTMAMLAAVVLVGAGVAAYLGYLDLSHFRDNLTASTGWVGDQLAGAKDMVLKFIGASLSGTIGFIIGFTRK